MNDLKGSAELIPASEVEGCEAWQMPSLDSATKVIAAVEKNRGKDRGKQAVKASRVEPLTASKIEIIREQAYQEGLELGKQDGYRTGMQQAQAEVEKTLGQLNRVMGQLMHPLAEQEKDIEQALVNLALSIARAVVNKAVEVDTERLLNVVNQALAELPDASQHIRVIVHPRDAELLAKMPPQATEWKIVADDSLVSGGCIVKTDHSYVDYTLEKQFQLTVDEMVQQQLKHPATLPDKPQENE